MKEIKWEIAKTLTDVLFIDVRSPGEYAEDHIPGAINLPIFNDEERKEIGILYKQVGVKEAIDRGTELGGKNISEIISGLRQYKVKDYIIYCFRGGMRSGSVVSLLDSLGFNVMKLEKGYKGYRHWVVETLSDYKATVPFYVLQGLTGTGKTELIKKIPYSIDLEGIAGHRSSVFGGLGLTTVSQKTFDTLLVKKLEEAEKYPYCVVEGESAKIGKIFMPEFMIKIIRTSKLVLVTADMDRRIDIILNEYRCNHTIEIIEKILKSIENRIGKKNAAEILEHYRNNRFREFTGELLEKYYDRLYEHSFAKYDFVNTFENIDTETTAKQITDYIEKDISST